MKQAADVARPALETERFAKKFEFHFPFHHVTKRLRTWLSQFCERSASVRMSPSTILTESNFDGSRFLCNYLIKANFHRKRSIWDKETKQWCSAFQKSDLKEDLDQMLIRISGQRDNVVSFHFMDCSLNKIADLLYNTSCLSEFVVSRITNCQLLLRYLSFQTVPQM